jgi:hypothetical protein
VPSDRIVFAVAAPLAILGAAGGQWDGGHAVLAVDLERTADAPLYGLIASVAALLPVGEVAFRLALASALLGALALVGVARAARALFPKDPAAGVIAAVVLALAPPFREAAAFAGPAMLATAGVTWAVALLLEHARAPRPATAVGAIAWATVAIGSAPWLGGAIAALVIAHIARASDRGRLVGPLAIVGATLVAWWLGAIGRLPGAAPDLGAVITASGRGSATVLVGTGLLGAGFAAVTRLPAAGWLAAAIGLTLAHAAIVDPEPAPLLALLAIGSAVIPAAIVRVLAPARRHAVTVIAGAPLVLAALATGPALVIDDPGAGPTRLAADVTDALPAGPGVVFPRRVVVGWAIEYERQVAGARPDLELAPILPPTTADAEAKRAMMNGLVTGSDVPAFGRLDARLAIPRGRGFQLLLAPPEETVAVPPPADYPSQLGHEAAILLAIDRARYEAVHGRLGAAARAAGLVGRDTSGPGSGKPRFGAADLAILSTTAPSQPALFGFVPRLDHERPGPHLIDLLGDDLAWSAGIDTPFVEHPAERRLHGLWRAMLRGAILPSDPAIVALGPRAIAATAELVATLSPSDP